MMIHTKMATGNWCVCVCFLCMILSICWLHGRVMTDNSLYFSLPLHPFCLFRLCSWFIVWTFELTRSLNRILHIVHAKTSKIHNIEKFPVCGKASFKNVLHVGNGKWEKYKVTSLILMWHIRKMALHKRKLWHFFYKMNGKKHTQRKAMTKNMTSMTTKYKNRFGAHFHASL